MARGSRIGVTAVPAAGGGGGAPTGAAGGDLGGTYPNPTVTAVQDGAVPTAGIQAAAVTWAKIQNQATARLLGRVTAGAGSVEELTAAQVKTLLAIASGDVSGLAAVATSGDAGDLSGSLALARLANDLVTYAKIQNVAATSRVLGRITAGAGDIEELTAANLKTILALAFSDISGSVTAAQLPNPSASTLGGVQSKAAVASNFLTSIGTDGIPVLAQPTGSDLSLSDVTTNDVSTSKHGFAPKAPNDATKYLDGSGAYSVPAGGNALHHPGNKGSLVTGALAETIYRGNVTTQSTPIVSGTLILQLIWLPVCTVTSITWWSGTTVYSGTGTQHAWAALFQSDLTFLKQSTDDTALSWAATALHTFTLSSTQAITTSGLYYVGLCEVFGSGAGNGLQGQTVAITTAGAPAPALPATGGTSSTGLGASAPAPAAAISLVKGPFYVHVS